MAWTTPTTAVAGNAILASLWNSDVKDNTQYLKDATDDIGLVKILDQTFTTTSAVNVNNCFSASYLSYKVIVRTTAASATSTLNLRMRVGGVDNSSSTYTATLYGYRSTGATTNALTSGFNQATLMYHSTNPYLSSMVMDVINPAIAQRTTGHVFSSNLDLTSYFSLFGTWVHDTATAYDGFSLLVGSGTWTGTVQVYGYKD